MGETVISNIEGIPGKTGVTKGSPGSRVGPNTGGEDPDAIVPISPNQPYVEPGYTPPRVVSTSGAPGPGLTGTVKISPTSKSPKVGSSAFIGNIGWVAPGVITNMVNSI